MANQSEEAALAKRVERVGKSPNYLTMVIRGHFVIERALDHAILKYSRAPFKELRRLSFAVKVELATALGVIPKESRPLYRAFNGLRNRLAHDPFTSVRAKDAGDMAHCLSAFQRRVVEGGDRNEDVQALDKRELLWRFILAMYAELYKSIEGKVRDTIRSRMVWERVSGLVAEIASTEESKKRQAEREAEVDAAVKKSPLF